MPKKAQKVLSVPSRYKVLYGGRGSGKSYAFINFLIFKALENKRILCTREYQASIKDSVYRLLCDRIYALKLDKYFTIQRDNIYGISGSEFIFRGLKTNPSEIKSMEGCDYVFCEESEKISQESYDILLPTIRKPGSEILISFNPEEELNATYQNFVLKPPPDSRIAFLNYDDNDLFPEVLRKEMEWCRLNDPEKFQHIWAGYPKKYGQSVIFKNKIRVEDFEPAVPGTQFYFGSDFGFGSDPSCLIRLFIRDRKLYIDKEFYGYGIEIDDLPKCWDTVPGSREWRIICDSSRPDTISYMSRAGFNVVGAVKGPNSIEDGIEFLKNFESIVIHPSCTGSIGDYGNYRWKEDRVTGIILPIPVDKSNHACDASRYALEPWMKSLTDIFSLDYSKINKSPLMDFLSGRN